MNNKRSKTVALSWLAGIAAVSIFGIAAGQQAVKLVDTIVSSLSSTRSVQNSKVIPAPEPTFGGVIDRNVSNSKAWWPPKIEPKEGAPNVLLILIDDEGYGAPSTFGGMIPMPNEDQLAKEGLRYINFHTTSLCSPTRAALITGRNHHSVGFGNISELSTGFPGYDSVVGKDTATLGRILQANGYATSWFGKDHNVPTWQATENGPFDQWPTRQGFDYFYGFLGGDMNQWYPSIWQNTTKIFPSVGHPGYNLNLDLADQAIRWVNNMTNIAPKQPLFLYYAPGATHAPHQPTPEWIAKFKGKFDYGWNAYRDYTFKRQKQLGTIPQNAKLTAWPDFLPQWDSLTPIQKKVYAHQMEVYAAFLSETDYEVNRVIQSFKDNKRYDNTLIIYIDGDNGASAEVTLIGTPNEFVGAQGMNATVEEMEAMLPEWGGPKTYPHFAVPWAFALDTPFQWTKQIASYFGGTKNGMLVVWPHHISDPGGIRMQFAHVIDVVPTVLEAAGIQQPDVVDGVKQKPIEGVSFAYTFDDANANAPSQHHTQYFEMFANMAIYNDGWVAATTPFTKPWDFLMAPLRADPWTEAQWNLYHVTPEDDWSEATDVKAQNPDKLKQLQDLFLSEAGKHQVFPLNNVPLPNNARPSLTAGMNPIVYRPGLIDLYPTDTPNTIGTSYRIDGDLVIPSGGVNGVLVAMGGRCACSELKFCSSPSSEDLRV